MIDQKIGIDEKRVLWMNFPSFEQKRRYGIKLRAINRVHVISR